MSVNPPFALTGEMKVLFGYDQSCYSMGRIGDQHSESPVVSASHHCIGILG